VTEEENARGGEGLGSRRRPSGNDMIASILVMDDFDLSSKFSSFLCNDRPHAVNGGLIVRGRLGFNETFEE
jgi:hypothetical protein